MSSIGTGPGTGSGPIVEIGPLRRVGAAVAAQPPQPAPSLALPPAPVAAAASTPLDAGTVPVDQDRVAMIRKAIASDSYPVIPTKIGDAMIAAGVVLRMPK